MDDLGAHRREAAMAGAAFSDRVRRVITHRALGRCELCGLTKMRMQIHHRRPRGMGGSTTGWVGEPPNGLLLCEACHRRVENNREWAYAKGLLVRSGRYPVEVPVLSWDGWLLLLAADPWKAYVTEDQWLALDTRDAHLWEPVVVGVPGQEVGQGVVPHPEDLTESVEGGPGPDGAGLVGDAPGVLVPGGVDLVPEQGEEAEPL